MRQRVPAALVAIVLLVATILASVDGGSSRLVLHGREYTLRRFGPASGHGPSRPPTERIEQSPL